MAYTTIDDPTKYFDTTLWTGSGGAKTITGLNHKPDLIWTKPRNKTYNQMWSDSSRGFNANSEIGSNSTAVEGGLYADTYGYKSGHTADGWTMVDGTDTNDNQEDGNTNEPNVNYVGWTWSANGGSRTTFSESGNNPAGGYQANTTAGFSIVNYTGTGAQGTIAHGIGVAPTVVIIKGLSDSHSWIVGHTGLSSSFTHDLVLNTNGAATDDDNAFGDTAPTSSVFTVKDAGGTNNDGQNYIAYCFAPIQGYSKFGSYTGNGNADGPFVYTGFKPAWVMTKNTDNSFGSNNMWIVYDNKRLGINPIRHGIFPDQSAAESADDFIYTDFLSNGFKLRANEYANNYDGDEYIYMAFAEHPFVSSKGVPTTAR